MYKPVPKLKNFLLFFPVYCVSVEPFPVGRMKLIPAAASSLQSPGSSWMPTLLPLSCLSDSSYPSLI